MIKEITIVFSILFLWQSTIVCAEPASLMLADYRTQAKATSATFAEFSAERGRVFYAQKHPAKMGEISCATCHTPDPRKVGRTRANKDIEPLAPVANRNRFTDPLKVEKWFARNCDDVLGRLCTAVEKGDFIAYMQSVK